MKPNMAWGSIGINTDVNTDVNLGRGFSIGINNDADLGLQGVHYNEHWVYTGKHNNANEIKCLI